MPLFLAPAIAHAQEHLKQYLTSYLTLDPMMAYGSILPVTFNSNSNQIHKKALHFDRLLDPDVVYTSMAVPIIFIRILAKEICS